MKVKVFDAFKEFKFEEDGYMLIQKNGSLTYYNIRLMKLSINWVCMGATHECWLGGNRKNITEDIIYIDEYNNYLNETN